MSRLADYFVIVGYDHDKGIYNEFVSQIATVLLNQLFLSYQEASLETERSCNASQNKTGQTRLFSKGLNGSVSRKDGPSPHTSRSLSSSFQY